MGVEKPAVTLVKSFTYRGVREEFSNKYHFEGPAPTDAAGWDALIGSVWVAEAPIYTPDVHAAIGYGYLHGDDHAVASRDWRTGTPVTGTYTIGSGVAAPGDCAMWLRWLTANLTSKGRRIYLRKYYHGVIVANAANNNDTIAAAQKTALETLGTALQGSTVLPGGICGPLGAAGSSRIASVFSTTRTLKRRGRRPPPP